MKISEIVYSRPMRQAMRMSPQLMSMAMPIIRQLRREPVNTGASAVAKYGYAVFLQHVEMGAGIGHKRVMEFGPGEGIGTGLCWLLAGADSYIALDAHPYFEQENSMRILDELVVLFKNRELADWEAHISWEKNLYLDYPVISTPFPKELHPDLSEERIEAIRAAIRRQAGPVSIDYIAPWDADAPVEMASVDLAFSQAVLEHVVDLEATYQAMGKWIKPDGKMSHSIDLRSHGTSFDLNGQWMYSAAQWKRANNRQTWRAINRTPPSEHLEMIKRAGFQIVRADRKYLRDGIKRRDIARDHKQICDDDLNTWALSVVAQRVVD